MNSARLKYKRDTGRTPQEFEIGVVRKRGVWVLDPEEISDMFVLELFGRHGRIVIPDTEYIEWLEEEVGNV